jgi:hypothetical protein
MSRADRTDTDRLNFMELHLRREGAMLFDDNGNQVKTPRHAWAIASELDTLRETIDAMMDKVLN